MKLSCQEGLVPGAIFHEKLTKLESWGYDGVELHGRELPTRLDEVKAALADSPVQASTICSGFPSQFTNPDRAQREEAVTAVRALLHCASDVGAVGVIFVPLFGSAQVPDLAPLTTVEQLQRDLLVAVTRPLAREAADLGVCLLLEPLNRYEAQFPVDLAEGVAICAEVDSPGLRLMGDFFHMSIEEAEIGPSLTAAAPYLRHIHLADSNRYTPGRGHTDFVGPFRALRQIAYDGYGALECRVPDPASESLPAAARYVRECWSAAGR